MITRSVRPWLAAGAALLMTSSALAQAAAPVFVGAALKDQKGAVLGHIEKVVPDAAGRPRQVLVRIARVLRTLPINALAASGDAYVTVLTRAEVEALPPSD